MLIELFGEFLPELSRCEFNFTSADFFFFFSPALPRWPVLQKWPFLFLQCFVWNRWKYLTSGLIWDLCLHMRGVQHFNGTLSGKVNASGHFGTWKKNRWNKLMKHCVSSGRIRTVSHVCPAADHQLIQQTSITFSDSNKAIVCSAPHSSLHVSSPRCDRNTFLLTISL